MKAFHAACLLALTFSLTAAGARAQDLWTGNDSNGSWSDSNNWSAGTPTTGTDVQINSGSPITINYDDSSGLSYNTVNVDAGFTVSDTAGNQFNTSSDLTVGNTGAGTMTMSGTGSINNVGGNLTLGVTSGGNGTYNVIQGGSLTTTGNFTVGAAGTGTFNQGLMDGSDASTVNATIVGGQMTLGSAFGSIGTVNQYNGSVNVNGGPLILGDLGQGIYSQFGGTVGLSGLTIGNSGSGIQPANQYNLNGTGQLTVLGTGVVGGLGNATFTQGADGNGNTTASFTTLSVGDGPLVTGDSQTNQRMGTYKLVSGQLSTSETIVGNQGTGVFSQSGGTHQVNGIMEIGAQNTPVEPCGGGCATVGGLSNGTYNLSGGQLTVTSTLTVGDAGIGLINQTGGSVTSGVGGVNAGNLIIGNQGGVDAAGSTPAQSGGQGTYQLGQTSQTTIPTLQVYGDIILGQGNSVSGALPASGTLTIAGDGTTMNVNQYTGFDPRNGGNMQVGLNGTGLVTQTDASSVFTDHNVVLGANAGSSGTYTLNATSLGAGNVNLFVGSDLNIGGMTSLTDIYGFSSQSTVNGGTGTFNLQAGDVATAGAVNVGNNDGSGTLTISGGTLAAGNGMNIGVNDGTINNDTGNIDRSAATGGGTGKVTQTAGAVTVGGPTKSSSLNLGNTANASDPTTGTYTITGGSTLDVYGNADIGVSTGGTGKMTIGSGSDSPIVNIHSTSAGGDGNLTIGDAGTGTLTMNSGSLTVANTMQIGVNGTGTVTQSGGSVTAGFVDLSVPAGTGSSSYSISGGSLTTTADLNVGGLGTGAGGAAFNQSGAGSQVNVDGTLRIGNTNGNALYTLSGGTLTTGITGGSSTNGGQLGDVIIGIGGNGELDNSGGAQISQSNQGMTLGWDNGSTGTYKLTGTGSLSVAGNLNVGVFGAGVFQQGNGNTSNTVIGSLYIASGPGGAASSYTLTDGSLGVGGSEVVGFAAQGSFNQSGGGNTVTGGLTIGLCGGGSGGCGNSAQSQYGSGTYTLGGTGALSVGGDLVLGSQTSSSGTFNYNTVSGDAATLTFSGTGQNLVVGDSGTGIFKEGSATNTTDLNLQTSGTTLDIGRSVGGNGMFNLAAGSSLEDDAIVGDAGTGTFNNTGGTHSVTGNLILGNQSTGDGTYKLTAGGITTVTSFTFVGAAGTGTFLVDNSTLAAQGPLVLGEQTGSSGQFTLQNNGVVNVGVAGASAFLDVAESGTATYTQTSGATTIIGALDVGRCGAAASATCNNGSNPYTGSTGNGTLNLSGGSMSVLVDTVMSQGGFAKIGDAGTGQFNISNGASFSANSLGLGEDGGSGTVTMNGAATTMTLGSLGVGDAGSGMLTQNAGTVTVTTNGLIIGSNASFNDGTTTVAASNGTYDLNGGKLSVTGGEIVGAAGTGTLNQTGGTNNADVVTIGNNTGGSGTYKLSGTGQLGVTGTLYVGASGTGDLQQTGGTINATGLVLGNNSGGSGTYELSGGSVTVTGTTYLGGTNATSGTVTQTGGTASLEGNVILGNAGGIAGVGEGQYSLYGTSGASLAIGGNLDIAAAQGSSGSFYYNYNVTNKTAGGNAALSFTTPGSSLIVGDQGSASFTQGGGDLNLAAQGVTLEIGKNQGSSGTYSLLGGTLEDSLTVGDAGSGTFSNSGGTHTVNGNLTVGNQSTGVGIYTLGGTGNLTLATTGAQVILGNASGAQGTFNFNTSSGDAGTVTFSGSGDQFIVGQSGSGTVNQGGGNLNLTANGATIDIAAQTNSTGQYSISGGSLEAPTLTVGDAGGGTVTQIGGAVTVGTNAVNGNLTLGNLADSSGTYSLSGSGSQLTVNGNALVGNLGTGQYSQTGGAASISGTMSINSLSTATISGGTLGAAGITNGGTLNLQGGTTNAPITNNATVLTTGAGSAQVNGAANNNSGWSVSNGGTLALSGGFSNNNGGTLTVSGSGSTAGFTNGGLTNNTGATVTMGTGGVINTTTLSQAGGSITGTGTINVSSDYTNTGFGTGNSFNNHAGVSSNVAIDATGNTALSVTGSQISGTTLNLGIVHAGDTGSATIDIGNSGTTGPSLRGAVQNTGITNSQLSLAASNYGPLSSGQSTSTTLNYNFTSAGVLTSQSFRVVTNFDNVLAQTIAVTGQVNNYAAIGMADATRGMLTGGGSSFNLNLGNISQGSGTIQSLLDLLNAAVGPADNLSMLTNAFTVQNGGGFSVGIGAFSDLAAGDSDDGDLSISLDTSALGLMTETIQLEGTGSNASGWDSAFGVNDPTLTITADIISNSGGGGGSSVPEPASMLLLLPGLAALRAVRRRRGG